jgi:hypothetical protein
VGDEGVVIGNTAGESDGVGTGRGKAGGNTRGNRTGGKESSILAIDKATVDKSEGGVVGTVHTGGITYTNMQVTLGYLHMNGIGTHSRTP